MRTVMFATYTIFNWPHSGNVNGSVQPGNPNLMLTEITEQTTTTTIKLRLRENGKE